MKTTARRVLNLVGLEISTLNRTMVLPKPQPGPEVFNCMGIDWGEAHIDEFMSNTLPNYEAEYKAFPTKSTDPDVYFSDNPFFGFVDAAVGHSFIRSRLPSVVVEVGSGFSSRMIRASLDQNSTGRLISIDPSPRASVKEVSHEYHEANVQAIPLDWFKNLPADSILFIDSSHLAGTGSDVNYLLLEVLPLLRPGVLIHIHDIYLPYDYPTSWNIDRKFNYGEQYVLHALLCFSFGFRVLWPGRWVLRNRTNELKNLMPHDIDLERHCSFWLERN